MFGDLTTGAESDIQQLTRIARHMVGRWGMSRAIGPVAVLPADGHSPLLPGVSETSEAHPAADRRGGPPDRRDRARGGYRCCSPCTAHNLDALVGALLEHETLDEAEAYAAAGWSGPSASPDSPQCSRRSEDNVYPVGCGAQIWHRVRRPVVGSPRSRVEPMPPTAGKTSPERRAGEAGLGRVPEADLLLLVDQPAEVDLLAVS